MSSAFPILNLEDDVREDDLEQIDDGFDPSRSRRNVAVYNAMQRRRERQRRMGAGFAPPANIIETPGPSKPAPIAAGQDALPCFLTWGVEWRNPNAAQYPATGAVTNAMVNTGTYLIGIAAATGILAIRDLGAVIQVQHDLLLTGTATQYGYHQMGALFDPVNDRMALFLDGDQLVTATIAHATWAVTTPSWSYMWNTTNVAKSVGVGIVTPLEVFPNFIPPFYRP